MKILPFRPLFLFETIWSRLGVGCVDDAQPEAEAKTSPNQSNRHLLKLEVMASESGSFMLGGDIGHLTEISPRYV